MWGRSGWSFEFEALETIYRAKVAPDLPSSLSSLAISHARLNWCLCCLQAAAGALRRRRRPSCASALRCVALRCVRPACGTPPPSPTPPPPPHPPTQLSRGGGTAQADIDAGCVPPAMRRTIAVYEAGRALIGWITPEYDEIQRVGIAWGVKLREICVDEAGGGGRGGSLVKWV